MYATSTTTATRKAATPEDPNYRIQKSKGPDLDLRIRYPSFDPDQTMSEESKMADEVGTEEPKVSVDRGKCFVFFMAFILLTLEAFHK